MIRAVVAWAVLGVVGGLFVGCKPNETPVHPNGGEDCVAACVQARAVCAAQECPTDVLDLAAPTPAGQTCEVWRCVQGYPHEKNACLARAATPSALRECKGIGR